MKVHKLASKGQECLSHVRVKMVIHLTVRLFLLGKVGLTAFGRGLVGITLESNLVRKALTPSLPINQSIPLKFNPPPLARSLDFDNPDDPFCLSNIPPSSQSIHYIRGKQLSFGQEFLKCILFDLLLYLTCVPFY
jgi:hypothetical protein